MGGREGILHYTILFKMENCFVYYSQIFHILFEMKYCFLFLSALIKLLNNISIFKIYETWIYTLKVIN